MITRTMAQVSAEIRLAHMAEAIGETTTIAVMRNGHLLMGQRRDNSKWTMPGGGMNNGEVPLAGALRELKEEAGIEAPGLDHLVSKEIAGRSGRKVIVHAYRWMAPEGLTFRTGQDPDQEVSEWKWIDVRSGLPAEIRENLQSPKNLLLEALGLL